MRPVREAVSRRGKATVRSANKEKVVPKRAVIDLCFLLCMGLLVVQPARGAAQEEASPEAVQAEIESLKTANVAWREIAWKTCLLEGLNESRAQNKPVLLWIFIDRPVDDARC
jgi:hypothetical protein